MEKREGGKKADDVPPPRNICVSLMPGASPEAAVTPTADDAQGCAFLSSSALGKTDKPRAAEGLQG